MLITSCIGHSGQDAIIRQRLSLVAWSNRAFDELLRWYNVLYILYSLKGSNSQKNQIQCNAIRQELSNHEFTYNRSFLTNAKSFLLSFLPSHWFLLFFSLWCRTVQKICGNLKLYPFYAVEFRYCNFSVLCVTNTGMYWVISYDFDD